MKKYNLQDFLNPERQTQNMKDQLLLRTKTPTSAKKIIKRKRNPHEILLLMKTIERDIQQAEREGVLVRNGRKWKFFI